VNSFDFQSHLDERQVRRWQAPPLADFDTPLEGEPESDPFEAPAEPGPPPLEPPTAEELEAIRRQAWEEGHEEGRQAGLEAAQRESQERIERLDALLQALAHPLDDLDERVEQELVALAMAVARQLIRREIKSDPAQIVGVIREGVKLLPVAAGNIRLELHPEDAQLVRELLHLGEGDERSWHIVEDPTLTRGGCRIANDSSRIDATLETRINRMIAQVMGGERQEDRP